MRLRSQTIGRARSAWLGVMTDYCRFVPDSPAWDTSGEAVSEATPGPVLSCHFKPTAATEIRRSDGSLAVSLAELRLPVGQRTTHRVIITGRYGEPCEPLEYEVEGEPYETAGYVLCYLREAGT